MRTMKIGRNDAGQRLDKFACQGGQGAARLPDVKFIRTKKIKVNRARAEQSQLLREGGRNPALHQGRVLRCPLGGQKCAGRDPSQTGYPV